jgi:iron complex outermembrane recepter protein
MKQCDVRFRHMLACALSGLLMASAATAQDDSSNELDFLLAPEPAVDSPLATRPPSGEAMTADDASSPPETNQGDAASTDADETSNQGAAGDVGNIAVGGQIEPVPDEVTRRPRSRLVEEIVVTAQKREENLQDVPISVNAFSADTLDARGIVDPKDLPLATPGLTVGSQAGFTVTFLRGVGSDAYLLADPSVALYIDGIYFPFAHGQAQNFGSIERIEVLKGPQGTLFGRNAVGGAISVITQNPSFEAPSGSVQVSFAEYDDLQTKARVNIPLTDTFAIAVSGLYNSAQNYRQGTAGGEPLPREVTRGGRVKMRWAPVEALDLTLAGFRLEQTGVSTMFATNSDPSTIFSALIPAQTGLDGDNDAPTYFDLENTVFYGQASLYTDWFDMKLIGSDQSIVTESLYDFDGSPTPIVFFEAFQSADIQTAEFQILSNDGSWQADRLQWILGYYYFSGRQGLDRIRFGVAGSVLSGINDLLAPILNPLGIPPLLPGNQLSASGVLQTDSGSYFAQGTWAFSDWFSLTLGARLQEEKRTIVESTGAVETPVGENPRYVDYRGQSDTTRSLAPKATLEFRPWDSGLIYASYQEAVKSSTYNVVNFLRFTEPEPVVKEELTAYEVGLKTSLFDGNSTLSAAAFFYDIKNLQVQFISLLAGGAVTFETAPAAEVKGIDFDLVSQLFPDTIDGLVLTLGGAFVDARFTEFPEGQGFNDAGLYSPQNDYTGKRIPRSPRFSGTVGLSQTVFIPGGPLEIAADYYYNSGFFYLAQNTEFNEERAYGLLGARISYLYEPWGLRATVFGKNILDERYNYSRFTNDFGGLDAVAPPAVYGLRLNWEF